MISLSLVSPSRPTPIVFDLTKPDELASLRKNPVTIKEGSEYAVELKFSINHDVVTGLRYIQVVKRAGINVDKLDSMVGSFGPTTEPMVKRFVNEEAPAGMLARSGTYSARSRVIDDDKVSARAVAETGRGWCAGADPQWSPSPQVVYADFEWQFKLAKVRAPHSQFECFASRLRPHADLSCPLLRLPPRRTGRLPLLSRRVEYFALRSFHFRFCGNAMLVCDCNSCNPGRRVLAVERRVSRVSERRARGESCAAAEKRWACPSCPHSLVLPHPFLKESKWRQGNYKVSKP